MECNKDEALRAKALAEQRMVNNDFEGARRIALKAKQLFPEIDNISQLVTVCDIHCSAQKKIYGVEKDLYGILQVEKVADEATIRKQYRKLALVLHPDKNKFPGAEAAFKFVGEANMVLSDIGKRSVYDIKCRDPARASVTKLQNRQGNQSSYMAQNKFKNVSTSQFNGMNHQHRQSESKPNDRLSFWTYCPFCNVKYEYYREFINRPLRCQHCSKLFIAHDIGVQGAAMGPHFVHKKMKNANVKSSQSQSTVSQQKDVRRREPVKINIQKDGMHHEVGGCSRSRIEQEGVLKPKVNVQKPMETGTSKDMNKKRGRKMVVEFSESSSDVEDSTFGGVDNGSGGDSVNQRRSSQRKQQIPSQEYAADELSPQKRSRLGKKEKVSVCEDKPCNTADVGKDVSKQKARECADVSMPNGINKKKDIVNGEEDVPLNDHLGDSDPELVDCPDSEFTNFDKDKEEHCFAVDQIWACYDSVDGMPRFYAQVRKIFKTEFKLRITWLEPEPENDSEIKWAEAGLPVACGKFVLGETEEMKDRLCFSHQMTYKKGGGRSSYVIYPQKGEIWALYKDWDIKWSLDPTSHQKYKFDVVEVLSVHEDGIYVAFLLKVKRFVSVFQRKILAGLATHKIPSNEQFRFSHRIKSVTLTGTERAGVPTGSFELDTASLPLGDYNYHNEVSTEPENYSGQTSQSHKEKVKPSSRLSRTPKKHMNGPDIEMLNLRRSPRGLGDQSKGGVTYKVNDGQSSQSREEKVKPVTCLSNTSKKRIGVDMLKLRRSPRGVMRGDQCNGTIDEVNDGRSPFRRGGDRDPISNKFAKSTRISSPSACRKMIGHDFSSDKHIWKFQVGQIWAFWENDNGIRQCYAQIKQIESNPIRLRVSLLKICNISSNCTIRHNACGLFKVTSGRTKMLTLDSFSHNVIAEARGKGTFSIYPREQQIWALYKTSDLKVGECDIVEVLEADESSIKVLSLTCVPGNKFVFKAPRIQRSTGKTNVIPRLELSRFSHQIPAFRFTEEKDGCLRGCWELDPAAFTGPPLLGSN